MSVHYVDHEISIVFKHDERKYISSICEKNIFSTSMIHIKKYIQKRGSIKAKYECNQQRHVCKLRTNRKRYEEGRIKN